MEMNIDQEANTFVAQWNGLSKEEQNERTASNVVEELRAFHGNKSNVELTAIGMNLAERCKLNKRLGTFFGRLTGDIVGDRVGIARIPKAKDAAKALDANTRRRAFKGVLFDSVEQCLVGTDGTHLVAVPYPVEGATRIVAQRQLDKTNKGGIIEANPPAWKQVADWAQRNTFAVPFTWQDAYTKSKVAAHLNKVSGARKVLSAYSVVQLRNEVITFDPQLIVKAITTLVACGASTLHLLVRGANCPIVLTSDTGSIAVIMPIRVDDKGNPLTACVKALIAQDTQFRDMLPEEDD